MHTEYYKAAKDLDRKYHNTPDDENDPVKSALLSFGPVTPVRGGQGGGKPALRCEWGCTCWLCCSMVPAGERKTGEQAASPHRRLLHKPFFEKLLSERYPSGAKAKLVTPSTTA